MKNTIPHIMAYNTAMCISLVGIGVAYLPIMLYTLLPILIALGAVMMLLYSMLTKQYLWAAIFTLVSIRFGMWMPYVESHEPMSIWMALLVILLFLLHIRIPARKKKRKKLWKRATQTYQRDRIY